MEIEDALKSLGAGIYVSKKVWMEHGEIQTEYTIKWTGGAVFSRSTLEAVVEDAKKYINDPDYWREYLRS